MRIYDLLLFIMIYFYIYRYAVFKIIFRSNILLRTHLQFLFVHIFMNLYKL